LITISASRGDSVPSSSTSILQRGFCQSETIMCRGSSCSIPWTRGSVRYDCNDDRKHFISWRRAMSFNRERIICLNDLLGTIRDNYETISNRLMIQT
jgi:hypothetical protein